MCEYEGLPLSVSLGESLTMVIMIDSPSWYGGSWYGARGTGLRDERASF